MIDGRIIKLKQILWWIAELKHPGEYKNSIELYADKGWKKELPLQLERK